MGGGSELQVNPSRISSMVAFAAKICVRVGPAVARKRRIS